MTRRLMLVALLVGLLGTAAPARAHDEYRIIGTITKVTAKTLAVKQAKDGKTITMTMNDESLVTREKVKVSASELKAGLSVVVDACGDSLKDLLVVEVKIVPPPTKK